MPSRKYCVKNKTRETELSLSVGAVDTTLEPLTVLRVIVEGLAQNESAGLWLTRVIGIPSVPRIAPFDLIYLDREYQVVEAIELLPVAEIPRFKFPAVTALVLPSRTISDSNTQPGDQLDLTEARTAIESLAEPEPVKEAAPVPEAILDQITIPLESATDFAVQISKSKQRASSLEEPIALEPPDPSAPTPAFGASETLPDDLLSQLRSSASDAAQQPAEGAVERVAESQTQPITGSDKPEKEKDQPVGVDKKLDRFMRWLYPGVYGHERRNSIRRPLPGLVAYDGSSPDAQKHEVGDISSTGIYLRTSQRWKPGSVIQLTLQRNGPPENSEEHRVDLKAGAVRWGKDGVALSFILPDGVDLNLWEAAVNGIAREAGPDYVVNEMRVASAVGFLRRVCPPAAEHAKLMLHKEFSNVRVFSAVKIALKAESILAQKPAEASFTAHPEVVVRILDVGSWVDVDWIQDYWAGLLAASCTADGQDESTLPFIDLLGRLALIHLRILSVACDKAARTMAGLNTGASLALDSTIDELTRTLDSSNRTKIFRAISELCVLGLLDRSNKPTAAAQDQAARTMPTRLGMNMYARMLGSRDGIPPIAHSARVQMPLASYSEEELFYKSATTPQ